MPAIGEHTRPSTSRGPLGRLVDSKQFCSCACQLPHTVNDVDVIDPTSPARLDDDGRAESFGPHGNEAESPDQHAKGGPGPGRGWWRHATSRPCFPKHRQLVPFPKIGPEDVDRVLESVGNPDCVDVDRALRRYRRTRWRMQLPATLGLTATFVALALLPMVKDGVVVARAVTLLVLFVVLTMFFMLGDVSAGASRVKFFQLVAIAEAQFRPRRWLQVEMVRGVNTAGRAERALFITLQGSRRTWAAPPTVADRALELTYPLINVDIATALRAAGAGAAWVRTAYARMLYDAAVLVVVRREDLIPSLRRRYWAQLRVRTNDEGPEDRDALYLDPLRHHNRWQVIKDFFVPVAALGISILSLVISLAK